jgi:hypothetical protein
LLISDVSDKGGEGKTESQSPRDVLGSVFGYKGCGLLAVKSYGQSMRIGRAVNLIGWNK